MLKEARGHKHYLIELQDVEIVLNEMPVLLSIKLWHFFFTKHCMVLFLLCSTFLGRLTFKQMNVRVS